MLNKDKRSLLLCLVLGDGCLHYIRNNGNIYGGITIDHGMAQADYQSWKAKILSDIFNKDVKVRTAHKGRSVQVSVCLKRLRAWRRFTYPNNKKSIPKILKFIIHPEMAIALWFLDDGYVEPSKNRQSPNSLSAGFRLFTCDQTKEQLEEIQTWFFDNFQVESKIRYQKTRGKIYPFIKFNQKESLVLWDKFRKFALQFKSMQYKFRYIEQVYQSKFLQREPDLKSDDIVHAVPKT